MSQNWKLLREEPSKFYTIRNPTDEMTLFAIMECPSNIQYVKNPTDELKWLALNLDPTTFMFTHHSTKSAFIEHAVKLRSENILYVNEPDMKLVWCALNIRPELILEMKINNNELKIFKDAYKQMKKTSNV